MFKHHRCLVALAGLLLPVRLLSQQASLSPALSRPLPPDTVIAVWFFGRGQTPLAQVADAVRQSGGSIRRESRWLHAVSADLSARDLAAALTRPEFRRLQPVA